MPMLMVLALTAQSVTLEADPYEAALTCGAAVRAVFIKGDVANDVRSTYFYVAAASANGPVQGLVDRTSETASAIEKRVPDVSSQTETLIPQCRQRFPLAFTTGPVKLPADDVDRRMLCWTAATIVGSYLSDSDLPAAKAIFARFDSLLPPEQLAHRSDPAFAAKLDRTFQISLAIGNFHTILTTCEAAFPA